jgi:hypothetical protein
MNFAMPRALIENGSGARPPGTTVRFATVPLLYDLLVWRSESTEAATLRTAALRLVASSWPAVEATWALVWATGLWALGVVRVSESAAPATLRTSGFLLVCSSRLAMESTFWWV